MAEAIPKPRPELRVPSDLADRAERLHDLLADAPIAMHGAGNRDPRPVAPSLQSLLAKL